jgi:hypothetical protein
MIQFRAVSIGADALNLTATCQVAQVNGITSRGIFLLTPDHQVIFISFEGWRGPWTINLTDEKILEKPQPDARVNSGNFFPSNRLAIGSQVSLLPGKIKLPKEDIEISFDHLMGWLNHPSPGAQLIWPEVNIRLNQVVQLVASNGMGNGWINLLAPGQGQRNLPDNLIEVNEILQTFDFSFDEDGNFFHLDRFGRILGRGQGLTPSGDDVVIGILLALSRGVFSKSPKILLIPEPIVALTRQMTTSLSSCLIASAIHGQADERLLSALDGILFGNLKVEECAARLLAYGGSSGGDCLLGMYTALKNLS